MLSVNSMVIGTGNNWEIQYIAGSAVEQFTRNCWDNSNFYAAEYNLNVQNILSGLEFHELAGIMLSKWSISAVQIKMEMSKITIFILMKTFSDPALFVFINVLLYKEG